MAMVLPATGFAQKRRPDLTVSAGSVSVVNGKLKGSFVLLNKGAIRAKRFSTSLIIKTPGKDPVAKTFKARPLKASKKRTVKVRVAVPSGLPGGSLPIRACADKAHKVRERSERNNCRTLGKLLSSTPTDPIAFTPGTPSKLTSSESDYWVDVPASYDETNATPTTLFVWLHACGGSSAGDIYTVSPGGSQDWISIAVGGRDGECWSPSADQPFVMAAIADMKTHLNIDPRRVVLGGYSSGGDLAYRTAFYNADSFAGVLAVNTSPFRDTGSSQADSLAAAAWKFHVVHLAHLQDTVYPIAGVRTETNAMTSAGFPLTRVEVDGGFYDDAGAIENGHSVPGTSADIVTDLLPHLDDGWHSP